MFRKILVATDGSASSQKAADQAVAIAASLGAALVVMTADPPVPDFLFPPDVLRHVERAFRAYAREILAPVAEQAEKARVSCTIRSVTGKEPWQAILDVAREEGCDLIVMGSHGRSGVGALLLGSVTQKALAHATIPVLVSR
jgi:nucleotide-binding universal stress UspA family protein